MPATGARKRTKSAHTTGAGVLVRVVRVVAALVVVAACVDVALAGVECIGFGVVDGAGGVVAG